MTYSCLQFVNGNNNFSVLFITFCYCGCYLKKKPCNIARLNSCMYKLFINKYKCYFRLLKNLK